jgi:predicted house-cleaning noncanonical NTP pyrophosphatase (MazG superfamily)
MRKLVRDKIPEIAGKDATVLPSHLFVVALETKLIEEATEFAQAITREHRIEEAGDVLEVFDKILDQYGITIAQVQAARERKAEAKGRFDKRYFMEV